MRRKKVSDKKIVMTVLFKKRKIGGLLNAENKKFVIYDGFDRFIIPDFRS